MFPGLTSASILLAWLPAMFGLAGPGEPTVTRMIVQEQLIIKIPVRPQPIRRPLVWEEHKGPKCINTGQIRGAVLAGTTAVDFALNGGGRVRAKLDDDCPALDFYNGFYLKPEDERICADRDSIHSRMGGSCQIDTFRSLSPKG
ncbi:hypothetical protein G7077_01855 [Sphingomonas piscis]|uniref:Uncharacterized protein n=1 Tax=Sphingomonas piscis TaxID=2714943 RepID=A0A6G7YM73_9SPHN|nr:hypothetical protein [Sphingomonas piscis]QIK77844.1 hypothetical protein G7077_01855 [Sphingomonas piscis]